MGKREEGKGKWEELGGAQFAYHHQKHSAKIIDKYLYVISNLSITKPLTKLKLRLHLTRGASCYRKEMCVFRTRVSPVSLCDI